MTHYFVLSFHSLLIPHHLSLAGVLLKQFKNFKVVKLVFLSIRRVGLFLAPIRGNSSVRTTYTIMDNKYSVVVNGLMSLLSRELHTTLLPYDIRFPPSPKSLFTDIFKNVHIQGMSQSTNVGVNLEPMSCSRIC